MIGKLASSKGLNVAPVFGMILLARVHGLGEAFGMAMHLKMVPCREMKSVTAWCRRLIGGRPAAAIMVRHDGQAAPMGCADGAVIRCARREV